MLSRFSHVQLFAIRGTIAHQAPLSMTFSRQTYWSGLPCPPPGDLPDPGTTPACFMSPGLAGRLFTTSSAWEALHTDLRCGQNGRRPSGREIPLSVCLSQGFCGRESLYIKEFLKRGKVKAESRGTLFLSPHYPPLPLPHDMSPEKAGLSLG